uniref:Uncharacterized protein n=1 Tax=Arundo donax TaxID=35708 RepID=A0A0A8XZZ1_ARUDO
MAALILLFSDLWKASRERNGVLVLGILERDEFGCSQERLVT